MPQPIQVQEAPTGSKLSGIRTQLMGAGVVIHQLLKVFGIDLPDEVYSAILDVVFGIGVIYFRYVAQTRTVMQVVPVEVVPATEPVPDVKGEQNVF